MAYNEYTCDIPEYRYLRPQLYWNKRARGLGPVPRHPVCSVGEENVLQYPGDPYHTESILVHEFAHAMHHMGLNRIDDSFDNELEKIYAAAVKEGLWKGKYAGTNAAEYWAEGVQSYFGNNREDDHDHNHVNTRKELKQYDPRLGALCEKVFRGSDWQFTWPNERRGDAHLAGYDPSKAPTFKWPKQLKEWWKHEKGPYLEPQPPKLDGVKSVSAKGDIIDIFLLNRSNAVRNVYWINYEGERQNKQMLRHGDHFSTGTYLTHPWLVTDENDKPLGLYYPATDRTFGVLN
jgi:hypothetical protein